jgi:hypothetical protein
MKKDYETPGIVGVKPSEKEGTSTCGVYRAICSVLRAGKVEPVKPDTEAKSGEIIRKTKNEYIFYVGLPNEPGQLASLTGALSKNDVQIYGLIGLGEGSSRIMLCTDNKIGTRDSLNELGLTFDEEELLTYHVPSKTGDLEQFAKKLGDEGVNIDSMIIIEREGMMGIAFSPSNKEKAIEVLSNYQP